MRKEEKEEEGVEEMELLFYWNFCLRPRRSNIGRVSLPNETTLWTFGYHGH